MGTAIAEVATGSDLIVCFRAAYLKVLAQAWNNPAYKACLTDGRNLLEWSGFLKFLLGNENCYSNNFKDGEYALAPGKSASDVYRLPWSAKVTVMVNAEGPAYEPLITAGWMGPDDTFGVVIPPAPDDPKDYSMAIAAYLQQFPTLLGYVQDKSGINQWEFDSGEPNFLAFSNMYAQGIPFCWSDLSVAQLRDQMAGNMKVLNRIPSENHTFAYLLTNALFNDQGILTLAENHEHRGAYTLSKYFGFNNPWNFKFLFMDARNINEKLKGIKPPQPSVLPNTLDYGQLFYKNGQFQEIKWDSAKKEWQNLFNIVTLNFPADPTVPVAPTLTTQTSADAQIDGIVEAHALAIYNQSIAHYPFTCA